MTKYKITKVKMSGAQVMSVVERFSLLFGPLERGSTVLVLVRRKGKRKKEYI